MPPITCHVLDSSIGKPAFDVLCCLYKVTDTEGETLFAMSNTNKDGRIPQWTLDPSISHQWLQDNISTSICAETTTHPLEWETGVVPGTYKIRFYTKKYFDSQEKTTFYPFVDIFFIIDNSTDHYHIPLLLTNFSYTTYRGS